MTWFEALLLVGGGLAAGIMNTMAGGGSLLTVPLLVLSGLDGTTANGSNRVGVLTSNATAIWGFRREGQTDMAEAGPILVPTLVGALIGAAASTQFDPDTFEQVFGVLMVPLLVLSLRRPRPGQAPEPWSPIVTALVFGAIGLYGGAFQAGVGLILTIALLRSGRGIVRANFIKVIVIFGLTCVALPIFIIAGQVDWPRALTLAVGYAVGGALGARITVRGGEKVVRPVLIIAVILLSGRLLGLY